MNFGTLFSGGEGVGVGLTAAGLRHAWGIEYDPAIAAVAQANGFDVRVADVRAVDYAALPRVDWLHASPVCTRASVANSGATEAQEDIEAAAAVVRALRAQQPDVFTLENVWGYRTFAAFRLICDELGRLGYFWTYDHVNAADFGVPQTRRRLVLRASRGLLPMLPQPVPWVGWYAAIADLIPTLPESRLAPWQLARLPEELRETVLLGNQDSEYSEIYVEATKPARSVTTQHGGRQRAVLVKGDDNSGDFGVVACAQGDPAFTLRAGRSAEHRAVLISKTADKFGDGLRQSSEPAQTIGANEHGSKGVLPARVVSMTPRALARFQSVPDWYALPNKRTLAAKVIGNMVPPLLMQRIAEGFTA